MEMLELPDELIRLIARQVLESEDGLWLWCNLAGDFGIFSYPLSPHNSWTAATSLMVTPLSTMNMPGTIIVH